MMVTIQEVQAQLLRLGTRPGFWAKAEIRELPNILVPGETMTQVLMGWYNNGFALLCCTDQRVLLVDKKMLFMKLEDLRYEMIAEVMYQYRLLDASLDLTYAAKTFHFKSWNQTKLRQLSSYIQMRVMTLRQLLENQTTDMSFGRPLGADFSSSQITRQPLPSFQIPAEPEPQIELPKNPYQLKPNFRRRKLSRFVTSTQLARY